MPQNRRGFLRSAAVALAAAQFGFPRLSHAQPQPLGTLIQSKEHSMTTLTATTDVTISPFGIDVPEEALIDLRARVAAARWPTKELVADDSQGVQLATLRQLATYWGTQYDWRRCEADLNALPQFTTNIDGLDIHFIHVRSKHDDALPLIVTHGWPGSIIEQLKIIDPLSNPTVYGGSASDAFHLVIPSLPGYGFSDQPTTTGWDTAHVASAWTVLMERLGYTQFVAQGGDVGAIVTHLMAKQAPPQLLGIHTNLPGTVPPEVLLAVAAGGPPPAGLQDAELHAFQQVKEFSSKRSGYSVEMRTRPQTLYGLVDSPIGLAAWMLDHDPASYQLIAQAFNGQPGGLTRDDVLDNITLYWLTNTAISAARMYWENKVSPFAAVSIAIPAAVSVFPDEVYQAPRSWAERAYRNLIYYNQVDRGGHFAAWEQPELFADEVRSAFRSLR
jgi:pimeloyl-ACP methyl ester carboxylesterase